MIEFLKASRVTGFFSHKRVLFAVIFSLLSLIYLATTAAVSRSSLVVEPVTESLLVEDISAHNQDAVVFKEVGSTVPTPTASDPPVQTPAVTPTQPADDGPCVNSLGAKLDRRGVHFGAAIDTITLQEEPQFAAAATCHFNGTVAEYEMKWDPLRTQSGGFDFSAADRLLQFAEDNQQYVRGHALVWHRASEKLQATDCNRNAMLAELENHITTVVQRYKGRIAEWDVVNEAFADESGELRNSYLLNCIGPDYIEKSFEYARAADPDAKLFYNDYNIERNGPKLDAVLDLAQTLQAKGLIDGIGIQSHYKTIDNYFDFNDLGRVMSSISDLGLDVAITEIDVSVPVPNTGAADLDRQAEIYRESLRACLDNSRCNTFFVWGISDNRTWRTQATPGQEDPLLFDKQYMPKEAYDAMLSILQ